MPAKGSVQRGPELLYQADETPPPGLTLGLGLQLALLSLGGIVLPPMIVYRASGATPATLTWVVFASLLIAGAVTALQAFPIRRLGAGYVLVTGTTAAAIAVSVDALRAGGPGLLAALMIVTALFQLVCSIRISMFRRILTPTVSGTVLMLVPVTIAPIIFGKISEVPPGYPPSSGGVCALVTLVLIVFVAVKGHRRLRPWAPIIGIVGGAVVAALYGMYDMDRVAQSPWIGLPSPAWPAFEIDLGSSFWGLLPAFLLVSMSCTIRTKSASLAIQDVSWRLPRAPDLRAVQGAIAAEAFANLLAAVGGTVLHGVRSTTVSLTQITRVGARRVGLAFGGALIAFAFLPKVIALVLALPGAVLSAYFTVMLSTLFVAGMKMVASDGLDHRQTLIAGLSFWIGAGCQYGILLPDLLSSFAGGLLTSGLSAGGLTAILMTILLELTAGRRRRLEADLAVSSLPDLGAFVRRFASDTGWAPAMVDRLDAVAEETVLTLLQDDASPNTHARRLRVTAHREGGAAVLEFVAKSGDSNIEDRIAVLGDSSPGHPVDREVSLRLLRHLASEVRHRQYHDIDLVTVRVESPESAPEG